MSKSKSKPYWEMNLDELRDATKQFDKSIPLSKTRPLTKSERAEFEESRNAGVRSIFISRRPKTVTLQLPEAVIARSNDYALRHHMTLSEVVERSLRSALTFAE